MSGRRASSSSSAATKPRWSRPREREESRLAILDAARRLAELHGEAALTLSAVASEAGIARATIYGYFAGKGELLSQLSGEAPPEPGLPYEAELEVPDEPEPELQSEPEPEPPGEPEPELPREAAPKEDAPTPVEANGEDERLAVPEDSADYGEMMRRQAEQLDKLAKRIIVPKTAMKEGTDGALTRMDGRLRVIEQTVTDIEGRRVRDAKELGEQFASAIEAVEQRQKRLENADNRQLAAIAELRLELVNLSNRIKEESRPEAVVEAGDFQPWQKPPAFVTPEPDGAAPENSQHAYLSSARRAAIDAAAATEQNIEEPGRRPIWHWLLGAVVLAGAGLGVAFNLQSNVATPAHEETRLVTQNIGLMPGRQSQTRSVTALAKAGNAPAQLILGLKFLNGTGTAMNIRKAAGWLERAAENGQPVAQETIGVLYQTGTGVAADMPKAIRWYEAAASAGNIKAMTNLGKVYAGGWSEGTDFAKAAPWFVRAAGLGDVDAQFDLAVLYERGAGVPRSLSDAYKWYAIAAAQGDREAGTQAGIVAGRLSPSDLQAAKKAAADFKPHAINRAANDTPIAATILGARR